MKYGSFERSIVSSASRRRRSLLSIACTRTTAVRDWRVFRSGLTRGQAGHGHQPHLHLDLIWCHDIGQADNKSYFYFSGFPSKSEHRCALADQEDPLSAEVLSKSLESALGTYLILCGGMSSRADLAAMLSRVKETHPLCRSKAACELPACDRPYRLAPDGSRTFFCLR
jgi:hypothetical protein